MTTANDKAFLARKVLSSDGPNAMERQHDASLAEWCLTRLEPEEESHRRRSVLERIHSSVRTWIRQTMITEFRMPESDAAMVEGRIFATGSYRYNVHTSGSDIDMVLIAPNRITRDHFFMKLAPRLKAEPWVSDLHCIQDSRVPIIAMVCDGIDIDLSFGCIRQDRVPEVITDDLLQGLDDQSILSCNAVRVAHSIMDLVPNKAAFRQTLRFVKAWGKSRAIYSNTFGFPSGIGWAILVAFACQCYPNQNPAGMVCKFFRLYHMWFKPNPHEAGVENNAIYLTESMRVKTNNLGKAWDPRTSKSDARALFPVLTPAAPYGNACFNVTLTNLKQLCDEFARGYEITSGSVSLSPAEAKATMGAYGIWSKVLEPVSFFGCYRHYMHVQVSCRDAEHYQAYADGVESRIRTLWAGNATSWGHTLEDMKQLRLHLNPRRYEDPEEVAIRSGLLAQCKAANARASAGLSRRGSTMADSSAHSSPRSSALPSAVGGPTTSTSPTIAAGGTTWFTAHYFIGLTVNTSVSSAPIDVAPSIRVFHTAVKQLRQYREGVTKLPVIAVCEMQGIPSFVKEEAGYVEPVATDGGDDAVAAAGPASEAGANNTSSEPQNSMSSVGPAQGNGDAAVSGTSMKRGREEGGEGISTVPATKKTANSSPVDEPDDLEMALGLDF